MLCQQALKRDIFQPRFCISLVAQAGDSAVEQKAHGHQRIVEYSLPPAADQQIASLKDGFSRGEERLPAHVTCRIHAADKESPEASARRRPAPLYAGNQRLRV